MPHPFPLPHPATQVPPSPPPTPYPNTLYTAKKPPLPRIPAHLGSRGPVGAQGRWSEIGGCEGRERSPAREKERRLFQSRLLFRGASIRMASTPTPPVLISRERKRQWDG